jgi:hypothetical protein
MSAIADDFPTQKEYLSALLKTITKDIQYLLKLHRGDHRDHDEIPMIVLQYKNDANIARARRIFSDLTDVFEEDCLNVVNVNSSEEKLMFRKKILDLFEQELNKLVELNLRMNEDFPDPLAVAIAEHRKNANERAEERRKRRER